MKQYIKYLFGGKVREGESGPGTTLLGSQDSMSGPTQVPRRFLQTGS